MKKSVSHRPRKNQLLNIETAETHNHNIHPRYLAPAGLAPTPLFASGTCTLGAIVDCLLNSHPYTPYSPLYWKLVEGTCDTQLVLQMLSLSIYRDGPVASAAFVAVFPISCRI